MKQGLLLCNPSYNAPSLPSLHFPISTAKRTTVISVSLDSADTRQLTARERRQLRNERRESKATTNWREEVEERLLKKPKKRYASWTEELNLDNLALLGPQWWVVRVSRVSGQESAERLARSLARNFPDIDFKVYVPSVQVKRKLKNGSISVKPKPLFPGCVFLRCVLNKETHDFIRECDGIGGFVGSKVGNTKRQINKPRPVSVDDIEAIFKQSKEEQEKADKAFEEEQQKEETINPEKLIIYPHLDSKDVTISVVDSKPKRRSRKASNLLQMVHQQQSMISSLNQVQPSELYLGLLQSSRAALKSWIAKMESVPCATSAMVPGSVCTACQVDFLLPTHIAAQLHPEEKVLFLATMLPVCQEHCTNNASSTRSADYVMNSRFSVTPEQYHWLRNLGWDVECLDVTLRLGTHFQREGTE
ncbi:hypothetical protein CK203_018693 [Vitis vinifera]|uniref:NusG-like N-terminal domain-containing protein n=1 Tax=Vitis vinifera TaxID=29760 RepID=A0A438JB84_VITVI|nr:hypothetical protein CK203_018693 [Vitis vinifera]